MMAPTTRGDPMKRLAAGLSGAERRLVLGVCVISASDENQFSQEGQQWGGHGVFTHFLLQGLKELLESFVVVLQRQLDLGLLEVDVA